MIEINVPYSMQKATIGVIFVQCTSTCTCTTRIGACTLYNGMALGHTFVYITK